MKRFADMLARQKRIRLPAGYGTSGAICRAFLEQHAPKKAVGEADAERGSRVATPAQVSGAEGTQPARKRRRATDTTAATPPRKRATRGKKPRKTKFGNPPKKASPGLYLRDVGRNTPLKNSVRQQGSRAKARGSLRRRRLVRTSRYRSLRIQGKRLAVTHAG